MIDLSPFIRESITRRNFLERPIGRRVTITNQ
jgi:hypothetical protein